jgi:hypothetical protein
VNQPIKTNPQMTFPNENRPSKMSVSPRKLEQARLLDAELNSATEKKDSSEGVQQARTIGFKKTHKGRLTASNVFVRIRPFAAEGGHADTGVQVAKLLEGWTDHSVTLSTTYMFSKGSAEYTFPRLVLGQQETQQGVYDTTAPAMVEAFTQRKGHNVLFLAYGQTGTGKTHTMFGPDVGMDAGDFHHDWGLFPRIVHNVLQVMRGRTGDTCFILSACAIEFYMAMANDLLNDNTPIQVSSY